MFHDSNSVAFLAEKLGEEGTARANERHESARIISRLARMQSSSAVTYNAVSVSSGAGRARQIPRPSSLAHSSGALGQPLSQ